MHKELVRNVINERIGELAEGLGDPVEATEIVLGAFGWLRLENGLYRARGASGQGIRAEQCVDYMATALTDGI